MQIHASTTLRYKFELVRKGKVVLSLPFVDNMITDAGLNLVGTYSQGFVGCSYEPILGEGVTPTAIRRDSGAVTFTQSGTTITASSGFFLADDDGRLFKWGTGSAGVEGYLTYIDSTHATYTVSQTVASPTVGTVWYVNAASLQTPIAGLSWSTVPGALNNFSTGNVVGSVCTVTHQTVRQSSPFAANKTLSEIAFTHNATNVNVFDRDLINPTVPVFIGDQARVTIQTIVSYSSVTPVAASDVGTGCDTTGTFQIEALAMLPGAATSGISCWDSNGNLTTGPLEPAYNPYIRCLDVDFTLNAFNLTATNDRGTGNAQPCVQQAYGTNNYYRDYHATFPTNVLHTNPIYGICVTNMHFTTGNLVTLKLTTPIVKTSLETFEVRLRKSWSRVLTN